jgi:TRAP-type mannitol/chloroaromatic compound transport system substrate-binding protein
MINCNSLKNDIMAIEFLAKIRSDLRMYEKYIEQTLDQCRELLNENARLRERIQELEKQKREA